MNQNLLYIHIPLLILLIIVTIIEVRTYIVPDTAIVLGIIGGLVLSKLFGYHAWPSYIISAVAVPLILTILNTIWEQRTGCGMIGMGIVKLFIVVGLFIGLKAQSISFISFLVLLYLSVLAMNHGVIKEVHGTPIVLASVLISLVISYSIGWEPFHLNEINKNPNQKLDPTVKTPIESGNEQGTAGQL